MTKVGRPPKRDREGKIVHRKICSVYLDIRLVTYINEKVGNLSDWMENSMRSAFKNEFCFYCFSDKIEENTLNYKCTNPKHEMMDGNGAPSVILNWKKCECGNSYAPVLGKNTTFYCGYITETKKNVCAICLREWKILNPDKKQG